MEAVIYFSRRGENFVSGRMEELLIGNTEAAATKLAETLGAKLFELEPVTPYPNDYQETTKQAEHERQQQLYIAYTIENLHLTDYETIYLGYPNWWGGLPQIVVSFLQDNDWQGKTIYPFCTHEGSGMGSSVEELKQLCPTAIIKAGLPIRGSRVDRSDTAIKNWLTTIEA
ncbi:flavodoxin [Candidatus Enterococcus ferrettii]|uniref:Flavodoxin-like domain-containing protein n=1 Tax=Candidatus Enterococcus ferrettii TaxID=2815324 RepID=A0ABV0EPJ9_9ENTE|nr:flavodoxin [Enterococcus sp. 665A]MBO1339668.1 flavodoxin [Enterococcus sp. 665A]